MKNAVSVLRQNFKLRHLVQLLVLTVCFVIGASICYRNEIEPRKQDAFTVDPVAPFDETSGKRLLKDGDVLTQDFIYNNDQMIGVGVIAYSGSDENTGSLHLALTDTVTGEVLSETETDISWMTDMRKYRPQDERAAYLNVGMPTIIEGLNGRALTMTVRVSGFSEKTRISLYTDSAGENLLIRGYCYLYNFWQLYFRVFTVLLYALLLCGYLALLVWRAPLWKIFIPAALVLGLTYNFLLPPVAAAGELNGYLNAYHAVNVLSGVAGDTADTTTLRATDEEALAVLKETPDLKEYAYIHWNLLRRPTSTELTVHKGMRTGDGNPVGFVSGLLGIGLGRALGLNGITALYLARAFALLFYVAIFTLLIRFLPAGNAATFIFALSPAAFQCFATLSGLGGFVYGLFHGRAAFIGNGIELNPFWSFFAAFLIVFALIPVQGEKVRFRPKILRLKKNIDAQLIFLMLADSMFFVNNILSSTKVIV